MVGTEESKDHPERMTVAWWNTSLAPSGNSRDCSELKQSAVSVIAHLLFILKADFIALGEISEADFLYLQAQPIFAHLTFLSGVSAVGRSKFDICYIYNSENISVLRSENIISKRGNSTLKIAQRLDLLDISSETFFYVFSSHWPSLLWCEEQHADRHVLGVRLRDAVDEIIDASATPPYIILLGDYNDEPFAKSLSHHVMATRDIELVHQRKHLFYNPYWGYIGKRSTDISAATGSYYYRSGTTNRWHTFDQIIYSHAFIKAKKWRLADNNLHLSEVPGLLDLITSPDSHFDHIPVYGTIERVN